MIEWYTRIEDLRELLDADVIDQLPLYDVKQVIRCKKCKHKDIERSQENQVFCKLIQKYFINDFYCANGEKGGTA